MKIFRKWRARWILERNGICSKHLTPHRGKTRFAATYCMDCAQEWRDRNNLKLEKAKRVLES